MITPFYYNQKIYLYFILENTSGQLRYHGNEWVTI